MGKRAPSFWAAIITEANGEILKSIHLTEVGDRRPGKTLCGVESRGKGRKVDFTWWQMLPMTIPELKKRIRREGNRTLCPSCVKLTTTPTTTEEEEKKEEGGES